LVQLHVSLPGWTLRDLVLSWESERVVMVRRRVSGLLREICCATPWEAGLLRLVIMEVLSLMCTISGRDGVASVGRSLVRMGARVGAVLHLVTAGRVGPVGRTR